MRYTRLKLWCLHNIMFFPSVICRSNSGSLFPHAHTHKNTNTESLSRLLNFIHAMWRRKRKISSVLFLQHGCCTQQTVWILTLKQALQFNFFSCQKFIARFDQFSNRVNWLTFIDRKPLQMWNKREKKNKRRDYPKNHIEQFVEFDSWNTKKSWKFSFKAKSIRFSIIVVWTFESSKKTTTTTTMQKFASHEITKLEKGKELKNKVDKKQMISFKSIKSIRSSR